MGAIRALIPKDVTLKPFVDSVSYIQLGSDGNLYILDDQGTPIFCVSNICQLLPLSKAASEVPAGEQSQVERVFLKDLYEEDEVLIVSEVPLIGVKSDRSGW